MPWVVCEWGLKGIEAFRASAAVFVIVDVLSFSTAVSVAVDAGAEVIPFPWGDPEAAKEEALRRGAVAASPRRTFGGQLSLSPVSLRRLEPGTRVLLPSPNGSRLSLATGDIVTFCSSLRNFETVAEAVRAVPADGPIVVVPAGERWPDGSLRPAIEDWLGAGALIAALGADENSEATTARLAYEAARSDLSSIVRESLSGRELIDRGFAEDVDIALETGGSVHAPRLREGVYAGTSATG
jgi:2-phosphosulfolactate phosphatase